ncbi:MAG: hypothetical protein EA351_00355 [Gemmatimonadales bacterium]|nr:MAG: hypothetical protein EA351_00355 [Gemmatimonadales bacterium]
MGERRARARIHWVGRQVDARITSSVILDDWPQGTEVTVVQRVPEGVDSWIVKEASDGGPLTRYGNATYSRDEADAIVRYLWDTRRVRALKRREVDHG